jgi:hypothetical protein
LKSRTVDNDKQNRAANKESSRETTARGRVQRSYLKEKTMADKSKNDKERVEIIREITRLSFTSEGRKYLSKMLKQAKKELKEAVDRHTDSGKTGETEEKKSADYFKNWSSIKTYFFDLNGIKDQKSIKWEPVKVKPTEVKDIIDMVLPKFIKKLGQYEVSPDLLQSEIIELPDLDKAFKIGFTKKSETWVQGFIKEHEEEKKGEEDFVIRDDSNILVITKKYKNLKKDEMYEKIKQIMKAHPDLIEDIFFYSHMILKPGGG